MDRRNFLKLGILLPIAKSVIDKLFPARKYIIKDVADWNAVTIINGPEPGLDFMIDWRDNCRQHAYFSNHNNEYFVTEDMGLTWTQVVDEQEAKDFLNL